MLVLLILVGLFLYIAKVGLGLLLLSAGAAWVGVLLTGDFAALAGLILVDLFDCVPLGLIRWLFCVGLFVLTV